MSASDPNEVVPLFNYRWLWICLLGAIGAVCLVCLWYGAARDADPAKALLLEIECRTAFDPSSMRAASAEPAPEVYRAPAGDHVMIVYRVTASEELAAEKQIVPGDLPARLAFPVDGSVLSGTPLWLQEAEGSSVTVRMADVSFEVAPGDEARVGAVLDSSGGDLQVHDCPERWENALEHALTAGFPAGVWIVRNHGWIDPAEPPVWRGGGDS